MRPYRFVRHLVPVLGLCAALATPLAAHAEGDDEDPYPQVYGARPITLNAEQLVTTGAFDFIKPGKGADLNIDLDVAVDYGIMKNLTVGASLPFGLSPKGDFFNPTAYVLYRFLRGATPIELGVELDATFPVQDGSHFGIAPGLRAKYQINDAAQLRFGAFVDLVFSDPLAKGLRIPIDLAISFTRNIYFQLGTGIGLPDFDGSLLTVPLTVQLGYTLPKTDETPFLDIFLGFGFPAFLGPKIEITTTGSDTSTGLNTDFWQFFVGARFFAL